MDNDYKEIEEGENCFIWFYVGDIFWFEGDGGGEGYRGELVGWCFFIFIFFNDFFF